MKKLIISILMIILWSSCSDKANMSKDIPADVNRLPFKGEMTILAWYSLTNEESTFERFKELRECGFTHSFSHHYTTNDMMEQALDVAEQAGIKLIISTPELSKEPEETVERFMNHPATAGYFLRDEPSTEDFEGLSKWARRIENIDKTKYCYLNLFPDYASLEALKADSYAEYVDRFDNEVDLSFLSYDYYPIIEDENGGYKYRESYYSNLEVFLRKGQETNKPFWAFSLSTAHRPYPIATLEQMRFQMFSNLAYGAQGLQYFTYWTPADTTTWNFHHGPIYQGKRTEVYDCIKQLNKEIQGLSPVFLGAKVLSVNHIGKIIPKGTKELKKLPSPIRSISCKGSDGAIVSHLQNDDREFLVIVNRDFQRKMMLSIEVEPTVERVMKDGTLVLAQLYSKTIGVAPGDILIYTWK